MLQNEISLVMVTTKFSSFEWIVEWDPEFSLMHRFILMLKGVTKYKESECKPLGLHI